jgi:carboxyl-terminal processing protease
MQRPYSWVVAVLVAGNLALADQPAPAQSPLTRQQRQANLASFDHVWQTVKDKHWDPKLGGVDWPAVSRELRPLMERAETKAEARAVLREMLAQLKQTHFEIHPADEYEERTWPAGEGGRDGTAGIHVRILDGKALVIKVEEGSAAAKKGVKLGWEVRQVNDTDVPTVLEEAARRFKESTLLEALQVWLVTAPMSGRLEEKVYVKVLDGKGQLQNLEIPFAQRPGHKHRQGEMPAWYVRLESRFLGKSIGYIAFDAWLDAPYLVKAFDDALRQFKKADGIVIDLRGSRGGLFELPGPIAGRFLRGQKSSLGTMVWRQGKVPLTVLPQAETYDGPVAILVDGLTRSVSELFAGGLQELGRARLFGSRTAGNVLVGTIERLPNGDAFQYVCADFLSPKGKRYEGVGVKPDVEVVPRPKDLLLGRDPVLDAAVQWIRSGK